MIHPLHTPEMLREVRLPLTTERRTGRTTAIALRLIAEALSNPRHPIPIVDHEPGDRMDQHLQRLIMDIIGRLGLREFTTEKTLDGRFLTFGRRR